ncbi:unnamed protein product, partial [Hapterophycus canaliculatus]
QAYSVLTDPKRKEAYDRDGHPPSKSTKSSAGSAASSEKAAGPVAPPPPHPPTAPSAPPSAHGYPSAPPSQQAYGGWGGEGGGGAWQGMPVGGGYGQGWVSLFRSLEQQQQQAYPFQQGGFMQQQQQFQPQPGAFAPQQDGAFGYGSQYGQQAYPFPYQQQQQQQQEASQSWGPHSAYGNYDNAYHDYGAPPSGVQSTAMPPEPAAAPPSTELALPQESPPKGGSAYPGGHLAAAASGGMVAYSGGGFPHHAGGVPQHAAAYQGMMAPHNGGYPQQGPPSYAGLPPAAWAPPSTNPPSSESEESSESESEEGDQDLAVARYGSPVPPESSYPTETRTDPSGALVESAGGIIPRHPKEVYPRETRYVPPKPASQSWNHYPRQTRGNDGQQEGQERPGVSRGDSGIVVKLHVGKTKPSSSGGAPTSVGPLARRGTGSEGGVGGLMQEMDRVFSGMLGGSAFGAGLSVDVAEDGGSRRNLSRGFSVGPGGSRSGATGSGGGIAASMMSSHTVVNGKSRTLFSRTERTVVGMDGTRETDV